MGGGAHQVNKNQASTAFGQSRYSNRQANQFGNVLTAQEQQLFNTLFGSNGSLNSFLDPNNITQSSFNPAYKAQWNNAQDQIAQSYSNERGALSRSFANMGAGTNSTPSGFQADQMNKLARGEADTRGATFTGLMGQQYKDALNNFWNASNIASGGAATAADTAEKAFTGAGANAASLYGTAGRQAQTGTSAGTGIVEALCPTEGSKILMADRSWKLIEHIAKGDLVMGLDGRGDEVIDQPVPILQTCCEVRTLDVAVRVSAAHTFVRHQGGYAFAGNSRGEMLFTDWGPRAVIEVTPLQEKIFCRHLLLKRSHGYNVEGVWSLE